VLALATIIHPDGDAAADPVAAASRTTWGLAMVVLAGLLAGFLGTLLAAKYVAPALRASAAQQVAAQ
jgi:hypothetical protein